MNTEPPTIPGFSEFRLVGTGATATVFRARQDAFGRSVAVKVLRLNAVNDRQRRLFDDECRALGQLPKHPNIVTVFESGFTLDGEPFIAMEFCARGAISGLLRSGGLSSEQTARVGRRVATALEEAHKRGLIHRDVKPENVLISDLDEPVLSDFGIAIFDTDVEESDFAFTPQHVAPEVLRGAAPAPSTDVYSLGSTLYTLLFGHAPHQTVRGEKLSRNETLRRVSDPAFQMRFDHPTATPELLGVLRRLLAKDVRQRPANARDVVALFSRVEDDLGTTGRVVELGTTDAEEPSDTSDPDATFVPDRRPSARPKVMNPDPVDSERVSVGSASGSVRGGSLRVQDRTGTIDPGTPRVPGPTRRTSKRNIGFAALAAVVVSLAVLLAIGVVSKQTTPTTSAEQTDPTPPSFDEPTLLIAPANVTIDSIDDQQAVISWSSDGDPAIGFQVAIRDGETVVEVIPTASQPITVSLAKVTSETVCFEVRAVETSTGRIAAAPEKCVVRSG